MYFRETILQSTQPLLKVNFRNEDILKIVNICHRQKFTYQEIKDTLQNFDLSRNVENCSIKGLRNKIVALQEKDKKFKKNRRNNSEQSRYILFLDEKFYIPVECHTDQPKPTSPLSHKNQIDKTNPTVVPDVNINKNVEKKDEQLKRENLRKQKSINKLKKDLDKSTKQLKQMKTYQPFRVREKIKRKDIKISKLKEQLDHVNEDIIRKVQHQKRNLVNYHKKRESSINIPNNNNQDEKLIASLHEENKLLIHEMEHLKEEIVKLTENKINTKKDGKTYSSDVRRCVYMLAEAQVSLSNIPNVIRAVCEILSKREIQDLPDATTCARIVREMGQLSKYQCGEALCEKTDLTLLYDGTTKRQHHYGEFQVATEEAILTTGVSLLESGTAGAYSDAILKNISDLETEHHKILKNITNTMTDRHVVNKSVNQKLKDKKADIMMDVESDGHVQWNNFFCSMHPLDTMAKVCNKVLKHEEGDVLEEPGQHVFRHRSESGTQALIIAVCKLFYNDASGCPQDIVTYLTSRNIIKPLIFPFVGNRFNILFVNGGGVYFLRTYLSHFLNKYLPVRNTLQCAVMNDLQNNNYIAGCRALGLMAKYVTGPWQRKTEEKGLKILEMNDLYEFAIVKLDDWVADTASLVTGQEPDSVFPGVPLKVDDVYTSLITPTESDERCIYLLKGMLQEVLLCLNRQLADQLIGGVHYAPSDQLVSQASSCPATNISGERVFALLDYNIKRAPSATLQYHESKITFKENHTNEWLSRKSTAEQEELVNQARKNMKISVREFQAHTKEINSRKLALLREKQQQKEHKENIQREKKENVLEDLVSCGGLWSSVELMEEYLKLHTSKKAQIKAFKTQIRVRKEILSQPGEKKLFEFSDLKKALHVDALKANLITLINTRTDHDIHMRQLLCDPSKLEHTYISHKWADEEGHETVYEGYIHEVVAGPPNAIEYRVEYFNSDGDVYLQFDELVADIKTGDLTVLW